MTTNENRPKPKPPVRKPHLTQRPFHDLGKQVMNEDNEPQRRATDYNGDTK